MEQADSIARVLEWGQFGLAGLVIAALFWIQQQQATRMEEVHKLHADERREWSAAEERRAERFSAAIERNTEATTGLRDALIELRARLS